MPLLSSVYMTQIVPHCLRFDWQTTARACLRTRCSDGIRIDISSAMMAMTTSSSISVKALRIGCSIMIARSSCNRPQPAQT